MRTHEVKRLRARRFRGVVFSVSLVYDLDLVLVENHVQPCVLTSKNVHLCVLTHQRNLFCLPQ